MERETFGTAMRRLRQERGISLRGLSAAAHLDPGHLSKIENGRRPGTVDVARTVDRALDTDGELLAIARADQATSLRAAVPFDPMRRRTLVTWALTNSAVVGVAGTSQIGNVGAAEASGLQQAVNRLHSLDHRHGSESLWQAATALANDGYLVLERGTYSQSVGTALLRAVGRAQMCAGWLAFDAGQLQTARACYAEALALAQQANDLETKTRALTNLASCATVIGRPREALRLADAADRIASTATAATRLPAMPQLRRATASSFVGDERGAFGAIARARAVLDQQRDTPPDEWNAFLSPTELDGVEGTCAMTLGLPTRAAPLLERAIVGYEDRYARNRVLYRVRLAQARLDIRVFDGAAEAACAALDDLAGEVASWRVNSELCTVARRLKPYLRVAGVDVFLARFTELGR